MRLERRQLLELWGKLGNVLLGEGLLPASLEPALQAALRAANTTANTGRYHWGFGMQAQQPVAL